MWSFDNVTYAAEPKHGSLARRCAGEGQGLTVPGRPWDKASFLIFDRVPRDSRGRSFANLERWFWLPQVLYRHEEFPT